ncbi:MAG: protein kinase [Betaproteobacteria bacterium]|nr:protein kinase [Betaproteobacteria bacterium]
MTQAADFHLKELLYESASTRVLRALRQGDRRPVILKVLKEGDPAREHFERYQHEYELLKSLASPGIGQALDFVALPEGHALVLEDAGGESLARRIVRGALGLPEFLDIAIGACEALAEVHLADIIHRTSAPAI